MSDKIKLKKGIKTNLPVLDLAEPAFVTDEARLYIGGNSGNVPMAKKSEIDDINANFYKYNYLFMSDDGNIPVTASCILAQASTKNVTLTLPQVSTIIAGKIITVIKSDNATPSIIVQPYPGDTSQGNGTFSGQYASRKFLCTGTGWVVFN